MSRRALLAVVLCAAALAVVLPTNRELPAADPKKPALTVPDGFTIELVAGPPLVERPMMACFDDRGRLFVAESAGKNLNSADLLKDPPNFIRLLEDTDGDGKFDRSTVFADKMSFPMGVLWDNGALWTASPPSLWKLEDTDGDGKADKRTEAVTKFGFTGNAADVHGPFLGPDGWIYWCDGRHGHEIRKADGSTMKGLAARIFRCKPDGSNVEVVCGGGMDNPVEIAFTPEGEALATADIFYSRPARVDAIFHCIEGGVFPHHESYKEFKSTGDLLGPVTALGWVAPAGFMRYEGTALGEKYDGNLFSAQFNRHRIQRHVLQRDGATFRASMEDFLTCEDADFHPTDALEDADGSLLVVNTGGWFRIGCPTSQIAKPEITGGIYRVRRKDAPKVKDPRGLDIKWDKITAKEMTTLLDDDRFAVRDRAVRELANRGAVSELKPLLAEKPVRLRRNAVWALTRIEGAEARKAVRPALADTDMSVRLAATHSVAMHRDTEAHDTLAKLVVSDESPAVKREAATALGRVGKATAIPSLFNAVRGGGDRFLEHSLLFALITIADREATVKGLTDPSPLVRRAALITLDQMEAGNLTRDLVTPLLNTADPALQQTALAIITRRPGWASETVGLLREWLSQEKLDDAKQDALRGALLAFSTDKGVQSLVAETLSRDKTLAATRVLLLETMSRVPLEKLPESWSKELGTSVKSGDERVLRQALATLRATRVADHDAALLQLAADNKRPADLRLSALAAVSPRLEKVEGWTFDFLREQLGRDASPLDRLTAAQAIASAKLDDAQRSLLTDVVAGAGPLELPHLLAAFANGKSAEVGRKLVKALEKSPGLVSLTPDAVRRTLEPYPAEVRDAAGGILKRLAGDTEQQKTKLTELEPVLKGGDGNRGKEVFFGKKAACFACHAVKNEGGRVGPDLSTIGAIRGERDILESIVFPSMSLARGYEPYLVTLRDGRTHTGILSRDTADAIYLVTAERAEVRLARSNVESMEPSRTSIMPQGLDAQLSREELRDLIAFLKSLR